MNTKNKVNPYDDCEFDPNDKYAVEDAYIIDNYDIDEIQAMSEGKFDPVKQANQEFDRLTIEELRKLSDEAFANATVVYTPADVDLGEEEIYDEIYQNQILSAIWEDSEYVPKMPAFKDLSIEDKRYFIHLPLVELENLITYHRSLQPTSTVVNELETIYKSAKELELDQKATATQLPIETIKLIETEPLQAKMQDIFSYCKGLNINHLQFVKSLLPQ
ncbi:MAG: hypothetical protein AB8G22_16170 [Saprospiraceae bacterium]